jgi:hypothetical protein
LDEAHQAELLTLFMLLGKDLPRVDSGKRFAIPIAVIVPFAGKECLVPRRVTIAQQKVDCINAKKISETGHPNQIKWHLCQPRKESLPMPYPA